MARLFFPRNDVVTAFATDALLTASDTSGYTTGDYFYSIASGSYRWINDLSLYNSNYDLMADDSGSFYQKERDVGHLEVYGSVKLGGSSSDSVRFTGKLVGEIYRNETGVNSKSLKLHNHDTIATMNNEFKYETINTSGANYGTWNECHIAATGTATLRAQTNVAVVESTYTVTGTTLIGTYSQARADGTIAGSSFVAASYSIIEASAAMTVSHLCSQWLDSHQANAVTGSHQLAYWTNNGAATMDEALYLYGGDKISAFVNFDTCGGGMVTTATGETMTVTDKIAITIGGATRYLQAGTMA